MESPQSLSPLPFSFPNPSQVPSFESTFGTILLSTFISLILYGLTGHQTYRYFRMYSTQDTRSLKILILAIFFVDTFNSAILMHACYYYFVLNYFDPTALIISVWTIQILPVSMGATVLLTQSFYVRRIYLVNHTRSYMAILAIVMVFMLAELGCIIASAVLSFRNDTFEGMGQNAWIGGTALLTLAATVDLILTGAFVVILRSSRTYFERTNTGRVLTKLSLYAVIATSLNTVLTIPAFICSIALPQSFIYFAIAIPATKVYSNSVLAVTNCRKSLAGKVMSSGHSEPMIQHAGASRYASMGGTHEANISPSRHPVANIKTARSAVREASMGNDEESLRSSQSFGF